MPRATTKAELLNVANDNFIKMWTMIDSISEAEQSADFCFDAEALTAKDGAAHWKRDKNLRDVLVHLYEWHRLFTEWENSNINGISKPFLPLPYTWKTYGIMNAVFWEKHQSTTLDKAKKMLKESHKTIMAVIEKYTDAELFTKAHYKWTGTSSLGQYCISATASHYDWAIKKLKEQIKALKN